MAKDIKKKIKITAQTDMANKKLKQMKSTMDTIPKQMAMDQKPFNNAMKNMATAAAGFAVAVAGIFKVMKAGFEGLAQDEQAVHRMDNAIQMIGMTAQISAGRLFEYFNTLQTGLGASASLSADIAAKFIAAGVSTQAGVKQMVQAAIGLADHSGNSLQTVTQKLVSAMNGKVIGLKDFGVMVDDTMSKQDMLNEALRRGAIAFNNIDINSATRSMMIFKQSWATLMKDLTRDFLPIINKALNFIAKHLTAIGYILKVGIIFTGLKATHKLMAQIAATLGLQTAQLKTNIILKIKELEIQIQAQAILFQKNMLTSLQTKELLKQLAYHSALLDSLHNMKTSAVSFKTLLSSTNVILLAITVAVTLIITYWDDIMAKISGVTKLQLQLNKATNKAQTQYKLLQSKVTQYISVLRTLDDVYTNVNNKQKIKKNTIDELNPLLDTLGIKTLDYSDNLTTVEEKLVDVNKALADQRLLMIELANQEIFQEQYMELGKKIRKAQKDFAKFVQRMDKIQRQTVFGTPTISVGNSTKTQEPLQNKKLAKLLAERNALEVQMEQSRLRMLALKVDPEKGKVKVKGKGKGAETLEILKQAKDYRIQMAKSEYEYAKALGGTVGIMEAQKNLIQSISDVRSDIYWEQIKSTKKLLAIEQQKIKNQKIGSQEYIISKNIITQLEDDLIQMQLRSNSLAIERNQLQEERYKIIFKQKNLNVKDPFSGSALADIDPNESLGKFTELAKVGVSIFDNVMMSIPNTFSTMFDDILFKGIKFKDAFKDMLNKMIQDLLKNSIFLLLKLGMDFLIPGLGEVGGGLTGILTGGTKSFNGSNPSIGSGSDSIQSSILYNGNSGVIGRLNAIVSAIDGFTPVKTQVIDLPTLSNASTIGNAMILQGI